MHKADKSAIVIVVIGIIIVLSIIAGVIYAVKQDIKFKTSLGYERVLVPTTYRTVWVKKERE